MKKLIIMAVVAVLAVAAAILIKTDIGDVIATDYRPGTLILSDVAREEITELQIASPSQTVTIKTSGGQLVVDEAFGYPANVTNVQEALNTLLHLSVLDVIPPDEVAPDEIQIIPGKQTQSTMRTVVLRNAAGDALADLTIGAFHPAAGRFVSPDAGESILHVADRLYNLRADIRHWTLQNLPRIGERNVTEILITGDGFETIHAATTNGQFRLLGLADNEEAESFRVSALKRIFDRIQFSGIADPVLTHEQIGLTTSIVCRVSSVDGKQITAYVGNTVPDTSDRYVRFSVALAPLPPNEETDDGRAALAARVAKENDRVKDWVYIIPSYKTADIIRPRKEYLKEKPLTVEDATPANVINAANGE